MTLITGDIEQLSSNILDNIRALAEFVEADSIAFKDHGNAESLSITKNGKTFTIKACGNKFDGGFFGYDRSNVEKSYT